MTFATIRTWWRQRAALRDYRARHPGGLDWRRVPPSPQPRYDAQGAQIGRRLYVFGGYRWLDHVHDHADVFDLQAGAWRERIALPAGMPQSHMALATDGKRFIWSVSGQRGPQCSPAVTDAFVLDIETGRWSALPPLPRARYAGTMQRWRNRLHVVGGALEDRYTAASDHWSLGDGETTWREEPPIPMGGMHRGSAVIGDRLYVFGGQQGDFVAIPGDSDYTCNPATKETYLPHAYVFDGSGWARLPDLPVAVSHIEGSIVVVGNRALILGGQAYKRDDTHEVELTDVVQEFDADAVTWSLRGHLPYRVKTGVAALHDGSLFFTAGQRDQGADRPIAGEISVYSWRARL